MSWNELESWLCPDSHVTWTSDQPSSGFGSAPYNGVSGGAHVGPAAARTSGPRRGARGAGGGAHAAARWKPERSPGGLALSRRRLPGHCPPPRPCGIGLSLHVAPDSAAVLSAGTASHTAPAPSPEVRRRLSPPGTRPPRSPAPRAPPPQPRLLPNRGRLGRDPSVPERVGAVTSRTHSARRPLAAARRCRLRSVCGPWLGRPPCRRPQRAHGALGGLLQARLRRRASPGGLVVCPTLLRRPSLGKHREVGIIASLCAAPD